MKVTSKDVNGNEVVCFVRKPNAKDNREAKLYSNTIASQIMSRRDENGKPTFITRNQVKKILRDSGRLSEIEEKEIDTLAKEIREAEEKLIKGGIKKTEGRKLALDLRIKRNKLVQLLVNINELDEHTLEFEVENANTDYLGYCCSTKEDGSKLFDSVDDYLEKLENEPYAYEVDKALKTELYGTTEDMYRNNIENKFLIKYGYVNDKLQLINEQGKLIDIDGNLINEDGFRIDEEGKLIKRNTEIGEFLDE